MKDCARAANLGKKILQVVKTSVQLREEHRTFEQIVEVPEARTQDEIVCQLLPKKRISERISERMKEQLIDIPVLQSFCSSGISFCVVTRLCTVNVHVEKNRKNRKTVIYCSCDARSKWLYPYHNEEADKFHVVSTGIETCCLWW